MSPDRDIFERLRSLAQFRQEESERKAIRDRLREEADSAPRKAAIDAIAERRDISLATMHITEFPQLLEELNKLGLAAGLGFFHLYKGQLPHYSNSDEEYLDYNSSKGTKTRSTYAYLDIPYNPGSESFYVMSAWRPLNSPGGLYPPEYGIVVEATPSKEIILIGSERRVFSVNQFVGNIEFQKKELGVTFDKPFKMTIKTTTQVGWYHRESGGGAGS